MKYLLPLIFSIITITSYSNVINEGKITSSPQDNSKGYQLLKTYCYACHNPYVESKDKMLAPPMMRVKKHYKPNYPVKEDFINAIIKWVHHPNEESALMPGAVRKFKIMPPLAYPEEDLRTIAEYIFDNELEKPMMMQKMHGNKFNHKMQMEKTTVELNDGKRWKVDPAIVKTMEEVNQMLIRFEGNEVLEYQQLGKNVFQKAKMVIMNENQQGEVFDQLHNFFHGLENNMHQLMKIDNTTDGEKYKALLEVHARSFTDYFTAD
jgi:hypothetical protein